MLSSGEHVLLDVDFLHCFLGFVEGEGEGEAGEPDPSFLDCADRVSDYHAEEYRNRFDSAGELLDWLSFCGFLTVREAGERTYHVVFPSESMKWFMLRFIERSAEGLPFDLSVEEGVSKVLVAES